MLSWLLALAAGVGIAAVAYARAAGARVAPLVILRAAAVIAVVALLLDAPLAPARALAPWVALDASASWRLGGDSAWDRARVTTDSALASAGDSLLVFGETVRGERPPPRPTDRRSSVAALVDHARAAGRPVLVVTDGMLDDAHRLADLPAGSRVLVPRLEATPELAVATLEAPSRAVVGDSIDVRVVLRSGGAGSVPRTLALRLADSVLATVEVAALGAFDERELRRRVALPRREGSMTLSAALSPGDRVVENDSAEVTIVVAGTAAVALVSTSPDHDARFALAVLRGTQRGTVRAYWRVAPGQWREGDGLRPVTEDVVRRAMRQASLVVLHGDTAYFGAPTAWTAGAVVLLAPPGGSEEFYVTGVGESPLRAALAELPWDLLPPLTVGPAPGGRTLPAVLARRARRLDERAVVSLRDGARRSVVVSASGFWRWRTRGGRAADAFDALWGSIFDWVVASPTPDARTTPGEARTPELVPRAPTVQAGPVGGAPALDLAPRARAAWWLAALALLALSAEWVMRRRMGWR